MCLEVVLYAVKVIVVVVVVVVMRLSGSLKP